MNRPLSLGYSPCPNDTFIFHALVHGSIDSYGIRYQPPALEDVETLNSWAMEARLDVTKLSCHALGHVLDDYCLLSAGSALGRGCGPLLVAGKQLNPASLAALRIAIPGKFTTAALLLKMFMPDSRNLVEMRFDEIMDAVARKEVDAGVIIHESRFTYSQSGLVCLQDLGEWWEEVSGMPIPLGAIVAKRSLGREHLERIERAIRASVEFAFANPEASMEYVQLHSQEMETEVVAQHIGLYVNEFSRDLGREGLAAIETFLQRARDVGALPENSKGLRF